MYCVLMLRLLLALVFLSFTRLLFLLFNMQFFGDLDTQSLLRAFAGGVRFDITSLIVLNSLYILLMVMPVPFRTGKYWQGTANVVYYVTNIIGFALNTIDTVYFRFTSKRMTADIFSFVSTGEDDFMSLIPRFIMDFAWELIVWILLSASFVWIASRIKVKLLKPVKRLRFYLLSTFIFLITAAVSIIGIRGGFQLRPITIINAGEYAVAKNVSLVLNTPFTIIKSFGHTGLREVHFFSSDEEAAVLFNPVYEPFSADSTKAFEPLNVVLIIMESFGTEYIGALNPDVDGVSYTPNLDTIINASLAFRAYANGKQSIEALPAIVAGLPSLITRPYITSAYGSNNINGLANLLGKEGYVTSFFHGGRNGTMGFQSFASVAGYDIYYGKDEYGNDKDFDGNWGIYDGPFFDYFRQHLDEMPQPFMSTFFSLSSHHPYMVPEEFKGKFSKGTLDIHESIMYSDHVLGQFFRDISDAEWFENTLFIITADHTSLSDLMEYQTRSGIYSVPLVFYMPGQVNDSISEDIAQHTDILGSVLGFLNYQHPYISFGNDLFEDGGRRFSVNFLDGTYQLIMDDWSLHFDGKRSTGLYKTGMKETLNMLEENSEIALEMEGFLKAVIQQYNHRMIHNQLSIGGQDE